MTFFLAFCHHQPFLAPHRILFPFVGRTMHREFDDHKYRNGHSSPLKDAGEQRISEGMALADRRLPGVIGEKVVDRVSRFRVYELVGESIKNTWLPGKSYFAFLLNKTKKEPRPYVILINICSHLLRIANIFYRELLIKSILLDGFRR